MKFQEIYERCWKGYRQAGMKKKGDRMVPNCVPVEEGEMSAERNTAKSLARDLKNWIEDYQEIQAAGLDSSNINYIRKLKRNIETAHEQIRRLGYRFDANNPDLVRLMGRSLAEIKTGPEMTLNDLLYTAAARAMRDAGREGIDLDYEDAIKQAAQIYGITYKPSQLPKLRAQLADLDARIEPLRQQQELKKQQKRQAKYGTAAAVPDQPQSTITPAIGRIKPPTRTLEETEADLAEDLRKWFKEKWVRFGPDGKIRGACARGSESEGKPKCLPQAKAHALGKKGRASAAAKKRREDPNPERRGPAKNVATKVREQDVAEARPISRPEDAIAALKKFTAYLKKNINDLASMASFEGENYDQPYVDERFEGFLSKADGTPVTPIFNEGGKLALVGSNKQYLNIPTALYYRYPAFMYGGTIENDIMQLLGYKQKGIAEAEAKTYYRVIYNGQPIDMLFSTLQQAQMVAKRLEQEHGGQARIDHTVDVPKDLAEKQDACYRKVKSRYKVWPSAYASGALVQCRKKGAANWGTGGKKK